jgi:hypothetical protein
MSSIFHFLAGLSRTSSRFRSEIFPFVNLNLFQGVYMVLLCIINLKQKHHENYSKTLFTRADNQPGFLL